VVSPISDAFVQARTGNRLLFFPEVLPGFPNDANSLTALEYVAGMPHCVVKAATPVPDGHPGNTNDLIRRAHRVAWDGGWDLERVLASLDGLRPNFLVVYSEAVGNSLEAFLQRCQGRVDAVIFVEGIAGRQSLLVQAGLRPESTPLLSAKFNVPIVRIAYAAHLDTVEEPVRNTSDLLYLAVSDETGGQMLERDEIQRAVDHIKAIRDVPLMAGFGIRTPAHVAMLATIDGLDGITVGSGLFAALEHSLDRFKQEVDLLWAAMKRNVP
jgi:tryptophan synthase alpha chain